jgi:Photosynthetic reaction centre cytochrome C subunit
MKRSLLVTIGLCSMVVLGLAFTPNPPEYKNLKVLPKNITEHEMDSVMHHFAGSLGVRCGYCHVHNDSTNKWDMASDENKHKLAAREMYRMMFKINQGYFNETGKVNFQSKLLVTCYTCHRGNTEPATTPPPMQRPQQAASDSLKRIDSLRSTLDSTRH